MNKNVKENETGIIGKFSVALGLFDYINPVLYSITVITIIVRMHDAMKVPVLVMFAAGALLSLIFGFSIPTVKLIVGLGKMTFKMPVNLVSYVNTGILLSGLALEWHVINISPAMMAFIMAILASIVVYLWKKTGKFNTVAVLIGAIGYLLLYISLIIISVRSNVVFPIVLYALAIGLFIFLCLVGILSNLKNARVHWAIEISNVLCQFLVALATTILFL